MPTTCTFQLNRVNPIYNSGEYIQGKILLNTEKDKRINAVYVSLEGEAKVQWSITGKETANYYGHQQYLYTRTNVSSERNFVAGTHVYNISLRVPQNCPSSCSGPYGHIVYYMSVVLDKSRSFNEIFRQPIYVVQTLDLNINPDYAVPVRGENMKYFCQWPCYSGPIYFYLMLPFSGYTSGQNINYLLEIDNQSPHYDIWSIEASLRQHFVFLARKPLKRNYYTKILSKSAINESTLRLSKRLYEGTVMVPENTPRSTLNTNYIVFLHYTLQVKLKTGLFHYDANITIPIVIGTEPIRNFLDDPQTLTSNGNYGNVEETSRGLVTTQPTLRLYQELNRILCERSTIQQQQNELENLNCNDNHDKPPSYDCFLPPSFSYATLDSQETLDDGHKVTRKLHNILMPKFPDYNTFTTPTICSTQSSDCALNSSCNNDQYASWNTYEILNEISNPSISEDESFCLEEKRLTMSNDILDNVNNRNDRSSRIIERDNSINSL